MIISKLLHGSRVDVPQNTMRRGSKYLQQLRVRQHAFLQASVEEIDMLAKKAIHGVHFAQLGLKLSIVLFQDFKTNKVVKGLNKTEHFCS